MEKLRENPSVSASANSSLVCLSPMAKTSHSEKLGYFVAKRIFDVFSSLVTLILLSPLLLVVGIAIKLESKGPVFFLQDRVGKNKRVFRIYKFRSMCSDASQLHHKLRKEYGHTSGSFKIKEDPRITKVGKVIRKLSIDELPQLINIIKGDMSIVGPRPLPTYEAEDLSSDYDERFLVLPGLTCTWQISGRSEISFDHRMQLDVDYVHDRGFWYDISLILKTIPAVLLGKGAY